MSDKVVITEGFHLASGASFCWTGRFFSVIWFVWTLFGKSPGEPTGKLIKRFKRGVHSTQQPSFIGSRATLVSYARLDAPSMYVITAGRPYFFLRPIRPPGRAARHNIIFNVLQRGVPRKVTQRPDRPRPEAEAHFLRAR